MNGSMNPIRVRLILFLQFLAPQTTAVKVFETISDTYNCQLKMRGKREVIETERISIDGRKV